jgi:hypothetical protein
MTESTGPRAAWSPLQAIVRGGALVGAFDFAYATLRTMQRGGEWYQPWQGVASALLGRAAFDGGGAVIALGIVCHFIVALSVVTAYVVASRYLPVLTQQAVALGLLYGAFVFFFMNRVVIPLTRIGTVPRFSTSGLVLSLLVHAFLVGLPAALVARRVRWTGPPVV